MSVLTKKIEQKFHRSKRLKTKQRGWKLSSSRFSACKFYRQRVLRLISVCSKAGREVSITSRACPFRYVQRWDSIRWTNVASKHFTDQRLPLKHAIYASRDRKRRSFRDGYLCILAQLNSIKRASSLRLKLGYINFVTNFALWRERELSKRYQKLRISNICFNFIIQTELLCLKLYFLKDSCDWNILNILDIKEPYFYIIFYTTHCYSCTRASYLILQVCAQIYV